MLSMLVSNDQQKKLQYVSVAGPFAEASLNYTFIPRCIKPADEDSHSLWLCFLSHPSGRNTTTFVHKQLQKSSMYKPASKRKGK